jgi:hypothetical protein
MKTFRGAKGDDTAQLQNLRVGVVMRLLPHAI